MSPLWPETDLAHRQTVAFAYDHVPLRSWDLSPRILNALLFYNHKLTIGDVIRGQTNLVTIEGLGLAGIRELNTKIAVLLNTLELTMISETGDQRRTLVLLNTIGQLSLGLLHLDKKHIKLLFTTRF